MKRIITAVLLLILCVTACIGSNLITEAKANDLTEILDLLENELKREDYESALSSIKRIEDEWESAEKVFSSLSETKLIDELNLSFNSLEKYIEAKRIAEAIIVLEECRNGLETIHQWQKITIDNIL